MSLLDAWRNRPSVCRRRRLVLGAVYARYGLNECDVEKLAAFNADRRRGLIFSDETIAHMRELQARYDAAWREINAGGDPPLPG